MKLVFALKYDIDLEDEDLKRIEQVEEIYSQVSRNIQLQKQELFIQLTQNPRFIDQLLQS